MKSPALLLLLAALLPLAAGNPKMLISTFVDGGFMNADMSHGTKCRLGRMSVRVSGPGMSTACPTKASKKECTVAARVRRGTANVRAPRCDWRGGGCRRTSIAPTTCSIPLSHTRARTQLNTLHPNNTNDNNNNRSRSALRT